MTDVPWPSAAPTLDAVLDACPSGPASGVRRRALGTLARRCRDLRSGAVGAWVCDLLYGQIGPEAAAALAASAPPALWDGLEALDAPVASVTSGRYVCFSGERDAFDAETGERVAPPERWFEVRVFNLTELVRACLERTKKQ